MQIRQRRLLLVLLISGQLCCMTFGVAWATGWLKFAFDNLVRHRVAAEGRSLAWECATQIASLGDDAIATGDPIWQKAQSNCEKVEVPHAGHVVVFNQDTGALLCHSDLQRRPEMLQDFPGKSLIATGANIVPLVQAVQVAIQDQQGIVHGRMEVGGAMHVVTACRISNQNAALAVYQPEASIDQSVAQLVQPVFQVGFALTAFILGATSILTVFLVNRYETTLAQTNVQLELVVQRRTDALLRTRNAVVFGLAKLAESRDSATGSHLERIRAYVIILATELAKRHREIDRQFVADLAVASSLHDIGKVGVPDGVLLKPGRLTPAERKSMETHTQLGSECLAAIQDQLADDDFLQLAQQIAIAHHEHWDGSGYPQGLQRREIPLSARIVALADVYDALTTQRPYKEASSHEEARNWIVARSGSQFDPEVVAAFVSRERDFVALFQSHATDVENCEMDPYGPPRGLPAQAIGNGALASPEFSSQTPISC